MIHIYFTYIPIQFPNVGTYSTYYITSSAFQPRLKHQLTFFPVNGGANTITRQSTESSVTIPFEQTFRDLSAQGNDPRQQGLAAFNFCGCGWPQHMLVPKGTEAGAQYQLFVMLSNYELDQVS